MNRLQSSTQRCMLINYLGPDVKGHLGDSIAYLNAIKETDLYVKQIWSFIQSDVRYKDKTTLIVTNDHGRHINGVSNGFISHGDNCSGCRRIQLQIFSPDVQKATTCNTAYDQLNIAATIAELLQIPEFNSENGLTPMSAIFK
jgi:bisphosphoglycerate-independent phosphoglycerate mutase (AlkP superfamily)